MERKNVFGKEIRALMYAFGDDINPLPESVSMMDELLEWFIVDLATNAAAKTCTKLKTSDFLAVLEGDEKKFARAHELLSLDKELRLARATFGETVQIEMSSSLNK